jgi:hypothetical protein
MPQTPDPSSETLKTGLNLTQTPTTETIVAGGASSSRILNDLRDHTIEDIVELDNRTDALTRQQALLNTVFSQQLTALTTRLQSLENRLPTASGRWMADMYTSDFIHATNSAEINTTYGQATLPILTEQEKLVGRDSRDQVWIPKGSAVHYSYQSSTPQETQWLSDDNMLFALDQRSDTAWWLSRPSSGTVWIRVKVPANLNANKLANCIILHPYPVFNFDLVSVEYRSPAGIYTAADLSYLQGYNANTTTVEGMGNCRLLIPQSQITELRIKLSAPNIWGFSKLSVQQLEFSPTATLAVDLLAYNPGTFTQAQVFGKDADALAFLVTQINGTRVSVGLTQNSQNSTPVITQIEARL